MINRQHTTDIQKAHALITSCETDLRHKLTFGQKRDLLQDNTNWTFDHCTEVLLSLAIKGDR